MATYPIKALGALGVISDLAPTDLPPNAFTDAMNARFVESRVFKTGGSAPLSYVPEDKDLIPLSFVSMPFDYYSAGNSFLIVGTEGKLYKLSNEAMTNISRRVSTVSKKATANISIHPILTTITPTKTSYSIKKNEEVILEVNTKPDDASPVPLTWTVSNSSMGTITPMSGNTKKATFRASNFEGNVVITVANPDSTVTASIFISVVDADSGIFLNKTSTTIRKGGVDTLVATSGSSNPITWTSSNPAIASVSPTASGSAVVNVNGVAEGSVILTADNGVKTATCTVNVIPQIDSIRLNYSALNVSAGTSAEITALFTPANTPNRAITWVSTNPGIASVSGNGEKAIITGLVAGFVDIVATTVEGQRSATCSVNVEPFGSIIRNSSTMSLMAAPMSTFSEPEVAEDVVVLDASRQADAFSIDTEEMYEGNQFYDYTNVNDMEGVGMALMSIPSSEVLQGLTLDIGSVDINVGDSLTIEANVSPENASGLLYKWVVDKSGYVSVESTTQPFLKLTALKKGDIQVTCTVNQMVQKDYNAFAERPWYHTIIANCAVATTYHEIPQVKIFDQELFQDLPGWGDQTVVDSSGNASVRKYNWKCERVRAFNNRLFALNMREANASGVVTHYPLRLRWSNFAKENSAPTLWDDLAYNRDTTSDLSANITGQVEALEDGYAGYIDLADSHGNLIDMLSLKDYLFIYTEFETYVGSPTMNTYQPLMFKKLFNDSGILAPDCVCEVEGGHFVVTQNDIILHNGVSKKSLASNRVKDKIINEVCQVNPLATKVHLHQDKKEVWILYVGPGQEKDSYACTKAAVWNYEYDTWSFRSIPHSYCIGLVDPPVLEKGPTWLDFQQLSWDSPEISKLIWKKDATNFHKRITIIGSFMKGFYQVDIGALDHVWDSLNQTVIEKPLEMKIERTGIDFDNATNEWNQKHIQAFRPQVSGSGTYTFTTGGSQYSNEYGHNHSTKDYHIGKDRLVCVRLNHPYVFYNVIDNDVNSRASLNGITIEYTVGGRR